MRKFFNLENESITLVNSLHYRLYLECNKKKHYEILPSVQIIDAMVQKIKPTYIIDIGSGVGYLSCAIAISLQIPVLGLELKESNCKAAEIRKQKICSFLEKETGTNQTHLFKSVPYEINPNISSEQFREEILAFIKDNFSTPEKISILLIGLHTCGDLAPTIIRFFTDIEEIIGIYNLGCCYNRLSVPHEIDTDVKLNPSTKNIGFPLSKKLSQLTSESNLVLNRRFMLLGCQSIAKEKLDTTKLLDSVKALSLRAHFQVFFCFYC